MQISHQHKLIIFSQYGSYCRIDSYGDIPGQVVSLFDLRIWTLKSALSLYSGLGLLVVKTFPSEGEQMVREANGQSKLRFSQVFWTLVLAMTLSHNFLKMRKHVKGFYGTPVFSEEAFNHDTHCSNSLSQIYFFSGSILEIIYTLWIFFRGGSGRQLFQLSQQFATVRQRFLFVFQQQHSQLITYFHRPVIFPDLVDFPNDLKFSARNFHFPVYQQSSSDSTFTLNCSKEHILFSAKNLIPNRYTNQPTSRV